MVFKNSRRAPAPALLLVVVVVVRNALLWRTESWILSLVTSRNISLCYHKLILRVVCKVQQVQSELFNLLTEGCSVLTVMQTVCMWYCFHKHSVKKNSHMKNNFDTDNIYLGTSKFSSYF